VSRLRPAWPEVKTNDPWRVAWWNGPVGVGASSLVMGWTIGALTIAVSSLVIEP
jgi:hypothetical protein